MTKAEREWARFIAVAQQALKDDDDAGFSMEEAIARLDNLKIPEDVADLLGCYGRAQHDEPVFTLRAQDVLAGHAVRDWADRLEFDAARTGVLSEKRQSKVRTARRTALLMDAWPTKQLPD